MTDYYVKTSNTGSTETGWALGSFGTIKIKVAVDNANNKIYIQGLSKNVPEAWVVGDINGTTVTIASQEFGSADDVTYYLVGEYTPTSTSSSVHDVEFTYNANFGMLTLKDYDATNTETGATYKAYYYINETTAAGDLTTAVAYHEGTKLIRDNQRTMKTLNAKEIAALNYTYTYGNNQTGTLLDTVVVTDNESAQHAIALMRAVYTNQDLPGPYTRGYTTAGAAENTYPVSYAAVGTLTGTNSFSNAYGWSIPANTSSAIIKNSGNYYYCDRTQYKPNNEGYTLLLVEMKDDFKDTDVFEGVWRTGWHNGQYGRYFDGDWTIAQNNLTEYVLKTIKSVRLLTEAERVGTNVMQGTLFKIDATHLNRFFFLGKGQMRLGNIVNNNVYGPYYNNSGWGSYTDSQAWRIFYHMFEEFSPSSASGGIAKADIYKTLQHQLDDMNVTKTGFPVYHDCSSVPYAETDLGSSGHEFKMLDNSTSNTQAPDVEDLLFFVPDYRMMNHTNTPFPNSDGTTTSYSRDPENGLMYCYYNQDYAPRMDMYVIHLLPINGQPVEDEDHVYELEVNWKSNMSSFLPGVEQTFTLYRSITDADGTTAFEPVYKTKKNGKWVDKDGNEIKAEKVTDQGGNVVLDENGFITYKFYVNDVEVEDPRVPVVMQGIYSLNELDYFDYIPMDPTGKQVTYYVVGQDAGKKNTAGEIEHFLKEKQSNRESYMIPGYKKNLRLTFKIAADNSSKFDFKNQKNNYWNELIVANNKGTSVTANFLNVGTKFYFYRIEGRTFNSEDYNHQGDLVATATVTEKGGGKIKVAMNYGADNNTETVTYVNNEGQTVTETKEYTGQETFTGSKQNPTEWLFDYPTVDDENNAVPEDEAVIEFHDWTFYDNFTADVSKNLHPDKYAYRAYFQAAAEFPLDEVDQNNQPIMSDDVLSNPRLFKVYKTTPSVTGSVTLQNVLDDKHMTALNIPTKSSLKITAEMASLSELWRYEICRWKEGQEPNAFTYYGHVQNQSGGFSVKFGENTFDVNATGAFTTVEMEDADLASVGAYWYVPQAVVYTQREDNNTYGAPRVCNAKGMVNIGLATNVQNNPEMTGYKWYQNSQWYSYYNILMNFSQLNVPDGYELYKVRAWRKIDKSILGEEYYPETHIHNRQARLTEIDEDGWYLYEDINFGDQLTNPESDGSFLTMNKTNYKANAADVNIGCRSVSIAKPQDPGDTSMPQALFADAGEGEMRATFGALRMDRDNDHDGTLEDMTTDFKVRAYFTRSSNPLVDATNPIYVIGGPDWDYSKPLAKLVSEDGITYSGVVTIPNAGDDKGYFIFSKKLGASRSAVLQSIFGAEWNDGDAIVNPTYVFNLKYWQNGTRTFKIDPGTYKFTITDHKKALDSNLDYYGGKLLITPTTAKDSPKADAEPMVGSGEQYFVAEGEFDRTFSKNDIPTSIIDVLDVREVVGVTYYNVAGIESREPFDGVNIVVTRYSDGSMTTTKILK